MAERKLISLIGMSGSGKSHWAQRLEKEAGFIRFGCDDLIEERLGGELEALGYRGIQDVARWMGQPFDPQYLQASGKYLDFESKVVKEVLGVVERSKSHGDVVIDTTGSVIYIPSDILSRLARMTQVVYLETPETAREEMYWQYIRDPKPVIWGDSFTRVEEEADMDALARCYPELLAHRAERYAKLAHVTLERSMVRNPNLTVEDFITASSKL